MTPGEYCTVTASDLISSYLLQEERTQRHKISIIISSSFDEIPFRGKTKNRNRFELLNEK